MCVNFAGMKRKKNGTIAEAGKRSQTSSFLELVRVDQVKFVRPNEVEGKKFFGLGEPCLASPMMPDPPIVPFGVLLELVLTTAREGFLDGEKGKYLQPVGLGEIAFLEKVVRLDQSVTVHVRKAETGKSWQLTARIEVAGRWAFSLRVDVLVVQNGKNHPSVVNVREEEGGRS